SCLHHLSRASLFSHSFPTRRSSDLFTDVDSVYTVNPSIVNNPKPIAMLTYREMRELSYAGFSVFHDEALIPAFKANIPVEIKNRSEEHTSELQSRFDLVCRLLLEIK